MPSSKKPGKKKPADEKQKSLFSYVDEKVKTTDKPKSKPKPKKDVIIDEDGKVSMKDLQPRKETKKEEHKEPIKPAKSKIPTKQYFQGNPTP